MGETPDPMGNPASRIDIYMRSGRRIALMFERHILDALMRDWAKYSQSYGNQRSYDVHAHFYEWPFVLTLDPAAIESIEVYRKSPTESQAPTSRAAPADPEGHSSALS